MIRRIGLIRGSRWDFRKWLKSKMLKLEGSGVIFGCKTLRLQ